MDVPTAHFVTTPELNNRKLRPVVAVAFVSILLLAEPLSASPGWHVDCDRGDSLQAVVEARRRGQRHAAPASAWVVVLVSGTCNENVEITEAFDGIVLDGQGVATIHGPDAARDTLRLVGVRNFTIRGFTITGGRDGINLRGVQMVSIQRNTIRAGRDGIQVDRGSFAMITDNTLQNGRDGIVVHESSAARIGFATSTAAAPSPNLIDSNGRHGILVSRASTARIAGNTIANNGISGAGSGSGWIGSRRRTSRRTRSTRIARMAFASLQNSGVNLGTTATGHFLDVVNATVTPNVGVGIRGQVGGYGVGALGTLNGSGGAKNFSDASSIDRITPWLRIIRPVTAPAAPHRRPCRRRSSCTT